MLSGKNLLRLLVKLNALQLPFLTCSSLFRDFGIVNRYSWFWKSLNMADWGGEYRFFWDIHVRTDKRVDISISARYMATKFGKQLHLD